MKNTVKLTSALLLIAVLVVSFASCGEKVDLTGLWESATYTSNTTLGSGANTVKVEIVVEEQSVTLTIKTDKATLGDALFELGLVNDPSFFDTCNGMKLDWDTTHAYWGFYVDGALAAYGINDEKAVTTGAPTYKIAYTK